MRWLKNLFKRVLTKKPYSVRKIERRLKKFLKKRPRSEDSVIEMLVAFPVWYKDGIMRDMAIETLILLYRNYYRSFSLTQEYLPDSSRVELAYQKAVSIYGPRVLAAMNASAEYLKEV